MEHRLDKIIDETTTMNEMTTKQDTQLAELSVIEMVDQVQKIQAVMQAVMKEGEHYGTIPGTNKPTLLKPGAEKLCHTFRFDPQYEVLNTSTFRPDFINYQIRCVLSHIMTSLRVGSGMGSCNSRENKYRYRWVPTDSEVPGDYWGKRDHQKLIEIMGDGGPYRPVKGDDGRWMISTKRENDNPSELDNTLLKMACKRALVAAILNATAASDIFTQDLEDMGDKPKADKPKEKPETKPEPQKKEKKITKEQTGELENMIGQIILADPTFDAARFITEFCSLEKLEHLKAVNFDRIKEILDKRLEKAETIAAFDNDTNVTTQQQQDAEDRSGNDGRGDTSNG